MKTSKPVAGVCYNTPEHLRRTLDSLLASGRISQAYWVHHDPDTDSRKEHWHLCIFPTAAVDPFAVARLFDEADPVAGKPRRFLPNPDTQGRCLSIADWLWYAVHDPDYLASKGLSRNVHYGRDAVQALDPDELSSRWASLAPVRLGRSALAAKGIRLALEGKDWAQVLLALGADLARDPYLLHYLAQVCEAAVRHRDEGQALAESMAPTKPAKEKRRSGPRDEFDDLDGFDGFDPFKGLDVPDPDPFGGLP